jgi:hypothetical protein
MDEWLCVTQDDLDSEKNAGTTILKVMGINVIGDSKTVDLSDINMHKLRNHVAHNPESKSLCFLREAVNEMNYTAGAHGSNPMGRIVYSKKSYINKHMAHLGVEFYVNKMNERFKRAGAMHRTQMAVHYTSDTQHHSSCQKNLIEISKNIILQDENPR